jgi:RNA polymerase sigma factor (sigma-70 family)
MRSEPTQRPDALLLAPDGTGSPWRAPSGDDNHRTYALTVPADDEASAAARHSGPSNAGGSRRLTEGEMIELVARIRAGNSAEAAWDTLVRCLSPAVYRALGAFRLSHHDREEVFSATWTKLVRSIDRIEKPGSLVSWLMTTAGNEARQLLKSRSREVVVAEPSVARTDGPQLDEALLEDELRAAVWRAFQQLSPRCQSLLRLLTVVPRLSYDEIAEILGWPKGSIGPNRGRCVDTLRATPGVVRFLDQLASERKSDG